MQIIEQKQGAVTVLRPMGPLTHAEADQFKARLLKVGQTSLGRFVVDASAVPFIDSRGLEVLIEAHNALAESGQSLKVCGVNETLRDVLDLTEVGPLLEQFEDTGAAVRSFL
jgi:anti-anti-sigma factor